MIMHFTSRLFKCLLLVLGSLLLSTSVLATNVGGNIPTSTWTAAGNPYVMVANAYVASDNTLQIETGVQIQSPSGFSFGVDSGVGLSAMLLLWVHAIWTGDADVL